MSLQYSLDIRNARLDIVETLVGASPILTVYSGTKPADCTLADANTVLGSIALPADWMDVAANGLKPMLGTWQDPAADATGVATHFRIYASDGVTCKVQGSVTLTGAGGDMTVDNTTFNVGQIFVVTGFTLKAGNA